jgi:hypothetical protein
MDVDGLAEFDTGIDAEGRSLEDIAKPDRVGRQAA